MVDDHIEIYVNIARRVEYRVLLLLDRLKFANDAADLGFHVAGDGLILVG
jgi:hypothetical protein